MNQQDLTNKTMRDYAFLQAMYADRYFPTHCVDAGKAILVALCADIEQQQPKTLADLYALTHAATERFNDLQDMFWENDSEIETAARDCIGENFENIVHAYGFTDADREVLIDPRDW